MNCVGRVTIRPVASELSTIKMLRGTTCWNCGRATIDCWRMYWPTCRKQSEARDALLATARQCHWKSSPRITCGTCGIISSKSDLELDSLRQRKFVRPIDGYGLPAHVGFPGVASGFAPAAGFLFATKCAADFSAAGADVDVGDSTIAAPSA